MEKYTILCLNGGGIRGALQVGALKALGISDLHTCFPDGVYGVSIGAVTCALIAFKFTIDEIEHLTRDMFRIDMLLDQPRLQHFLDFEQRLGYDKGEKIYECLSKIFLLKNLNFSTLKIGDASVPLHIVASDITRCKSVIFNKTVRVWDALRASISLPLVFTPHTIKGRIFVDGAVLCKNILDAVPHHKKESVLYFALSNMASIESETITARRFMSYILHLPSVMVVKQLVLKHPHNVCILDDDTGMLETNPNIDGMLAKGESLCRRFLSESTD